ncbi:Cell cycle serine/threonine-protein kinase [Lachnellula occidentalis]|uniref:non-specific serine/threonine protein kinase n=1 Tax=Lachnellula occidentalis TaxID=215460 RepID=A0A8H8RGZ2_9HELO|nr:Cell cycle serine/threonine-protein kinase [Lachnellula occidentalis]
MTAIRSRNARIPFEIHHDELDRTESLDGDDQAMEESRDERGDAQEEEYSDTSDEEEVADPVLQEDMLQFQETFKGINERFRLIGRIGEGTFSTVYKAEDLLYEQYDNEWDLEEKENSQWTSPPVKKRRTGLQQALANMDEYAQQRRRPKYVAIKKIYVTSSPLRILNEIELLSKLQGCDSVCPLITAFRHTDQVVAVLPYFKHTDFRDYFRMMTVPDMQIYFRSLFTALNATHEEGILHRDIKPTNFLYDPAKKRGVLVDFGLAEKEGTDYKPCLCEGGSQRHDERRRRLQNSVAVGMGPSNGYPKNDSRPSRRANRAGTRGFRAPEVLFKCTAQTTKIDIWSAGVMLLTILSRRFPFFNSADDVEAMIEIATIFGIKKMKQCAYLHGAMFESNIPTISEKGFSIEKIILWSTCRNDAGKDGGEIPLTDEEKLAVRFLERCFELDPNRRFSAAEALEHDFLKETVYSDDDEMHMVGV